ncbi:MULTISPECIES: hypothetical protein [Marinobacter]|uniref:Uncharacterized protein n=1 Tax=Marinobacter metalliresistant TaxID=2961995 RepID=A0ABZ2W317_9GAMM|nr:hypothetical protein [Marinobacter sp. Arc7-DN-1]AXS81795.1 hypothetical protein D0851_01250 [Marinobacter sp. Arc7-DN-1]
MASPKHLTRTLFEHWETVESLVRATRDMPAFSEEQILAAIRQAQPALDDNQVGDALRKLFASGVLEVQSRSERFVVNAHVLEFVRGLTHEHELGLSSVIQARIEAIRGATETLTSGIEAGDTGQQTSAINRLSTLFRDIARQLEQDRHAIAELAEQAKSSDTRAPIARRYKSVLDAYDQYVEPMNAMMDSGPSGIFYHHLAAAEEALDLGYNRLVTKGALYSHLNRLRHVGYQAKELRRLGRVTAQQCADILLPLREEARQHNNLSSAISRLLGQVRKKGLNRAFRKRQGQPWLPVWRVHQSRSVSVGDQVKTIMAEARNFEPNEQAFPDEVDAAPVAIAEWIDEDQLRQQLLTGLPVYNLLEWLRQHYPSLPDQVLLRLYHDLAREDQWETQLEAEPTTTSLSKVSVLYWPYRLVQPDPEANDPLSEPSK